MIHAVRLALQIGCRFTCKAHHYGIYLEKNPSMSLLRILTISKLRFGRGFRGSHV